MKNTVGAENSESKEIGAGDMEQASSTCSVREKLM